jgi:hypothetical protein
MNSLTEGKNCPKNRSTATRISKSFQVPNQYFPPKADVVFFLPSGKEESQKKNPVNPV